MHDILNTFFILLKHLVKALILLPGIMFIIGHKTNSKFFRELAIKLLIFGIVLAIILTFFDFFYK